MALILTLALTSSERSPHYSPAVPFQMSFRARRHMEGLNKNDAPANMPKFGSSSQEQVRCVGPRWPELLPPATPKLKSANAILARGNKVADLILLSEAGAGKADCT